MSVGLSETSVQVEHCTGVPPQGKSVSLAIITDFCIYLYACFQIGQKRPYPGHLCTKAFAGGETHMETLLELGDMWPRDRAQLSAQQLVTQPFAAPSSYQVMPTGCDSAQGCRSVLEPQAARGKGCSVGHTPTSLISFQGSTPR